MQLKAGHTVETVLATFTAQRAALAAAIDATDTDSILSWDNGLSVGFTAEGKPFACDALRAGVVGTAKMPEEAWAFTPNVVNGAQDLFGRRVGYVVPGAQGEEIAQEIAQEPAEAVAPPPGVTVTLAGPDGHDRRRVDRVLTHLLNTGDEWDDAPPAVTFVRAPAS